MTLRSKEIYVSSKTKRRLFWIQKSNTAPFVNQHGEKWPTVDEIAERLLNEVIEERYPNIKALEKRLGALEDQLVSELLNGLPVCADTPKDA